MAAIFSTGLHGCFRVNNQHSREGKFLATDDAIQWEQSPLLWWTILVFIMEFEEHFRQAGIVLLFLPAYSPEEAFSFIKSYVFEETWLFTFRPYGLPLRQLVMQ